MNHQLRRHGRWIIPIKAFILLSLASCSFKESHEGTWVGQAPMVHLEYLLDGNDFVQKTLAANDVRIGGGYGEYRIDSEQGTIHFFYSHSYVFDNETNTGSYREDPKRVQFDYVLENDVLTLLPEEGGLIGEIVLQRE